MKNKKDLKLRAAEIDKRLSAKYENPKTALEYDTPLQLLIATILSAQCTDDRVNKVTPLLFKKYVSARDFAEVPLKILEQDIRPTGFFRNKAKSIQGCCMAIVEKHGGEVPDNLDDLVNLPGVGRKTANVVLGDAFEVPGVVVDTHVKRVAGRLGLTNEEEPEVIEKQLMEILPKKRWTAFSHELIFHGRETCAARKPACDECPLRDVCPWPKKK